MTEQAIDVVTALHVPDLERFKIMDACLERFWRVPGKRWVIVSAADEKPIREAIPSRYEVLVEDDLLSPVLLKLPGWWRQQLRKLIAGIKVCNTKFYQILDADALVLRTMAYGDLVDSDGRGYAEIIPPDCHAEWYRGCARLFNLAARTPHTVIASPMFFAPDITKVMAARLDEIHGDWQKKLSETWDSFETWTENSLYMTTAESTLAPKGLPGQTLFDQYHYISKPMTGPCVWYAREADAWSAKETFESGRAFALVQSNTKLPAEWVWERVKPFLSGSS